MTDVDIISGRLLAAVFGAFFLYLATGFLTDDYKLVGYVVWGLGLGFLAIAFAGD